MLALCTFYTLAPTSHLRKCRLIYMTPPLQL